MLTMYNIIIWGKWEQDVNKYYSSISLLEFTDTAKIILTAIFSF